MLRGVWTGRAARVLSVGFLGVSEETLEGEREPIFQVVGRPDITEKYRQEKLRRAFLHRVARHLGQQAGALQRARDAGGDVVKVMEVLTVTEIHAK